jgi:hypothetical protein
MVLPKAMHLPKRGTNIKPTLKQLGYDAQKPCPYAGGQINLNIV